MAGGWCGIFRREGCGKAFARVRTGRCGILILILSLAAVPAAYVASRGRKRSSGSEFNLKGCIIPPAEIKSGGPSKDGIPALTNPHTTTAKKARYLKSSDLVVGVVIKGQARAYPLRILVWHEIVNDTLGGRPVVVTYCPLCRSALVFNRRVGGQEREFGVSGRLWNSNVLMYDRQDDPRQESLWSQLQLRAVCGPAAKQGLRLTLLPAEMVTWKDWRGRHPETTVLTRQTGYERNYGSHPYARYFRTGKLLFPVSLPRKKRRAYKNKEPMFIVQVGKKFKAYALKDIRSAADSGGVVEDTFGKQKLRLIYQKKKRRSA